MRQDPPLIIVGERDTGSHVLTSFGILEGREHGAAEVLVKLLNEGHEVSLSNDLDDGEGNEGSSTFRSAPSGYERKDGGHGWQGEEYLLDVVSVRAAIIKLAPLNRGQHWSREGTISRRK